MSNELLKHDGYALILGASSGFGAAVSIALAEAGMDIIGVHLDRRSTMPQVESIQQAIEAKGRKALFFNVNAADEKKRAAVLDEVQEKVGTGKIRVLLHSLAFGTLKPYWSDEDSASLINKSNMDMTLDVMAHSLLYWTQDTLRRDLFANWGRIYAMTSAGSHAVWQGYGAVSAAKSALEAHIRQLAVELAPKNITANSICAGVTDTPALRKIPGNDVMIENAIKRNPYDRLTTPEDIANFLVAFSTPATAWVTGNTLFVDGGEDIAG